MVINMRTSCCTMVQHGDKASTMLQDMQEFQEVEPQTEVTWSTVKAAQEALRYVSCPCVQLGSGAAQWPAHTHYQLPARCICQANTTGSIPPDNDMAA